MDLVRMSITVAEPGRQVNPGITRGRHHRGSSSLTHAGRLVHHVHDDRVLAARIDRDADATFASTRRGAHGVLEQAGKGARDRGAVAPKAPGTIAAVFAQAHPARRGQGRNPLHRLADHVREIRAPFGDADRLEPCQRDQIDEPAVELLGRP